MSEFQIAVADRVGVSPTDVATVLGNHGIQEYMPAPPAKTLRVHQVTFSGFKNLKTDPPSEPYEFEWKVPQKLGALASQGNSVGKTSVIEIIRWLLSGRSAVDNWVFNRVNRAALKFSLDGQPFTVEAQRIGSSVEGSLRLRDAVIRTFDHTTFEGVMEELFLPRLGLDRIPTFQRFKNSERGQITSAGWPLLIDALHVRPSELSTVIGGVATKAGLLLQVYLALPWIETLLQARATLLAARQAATDRARNAQAQDQIRHGETERIDSQLQAARTALANMKDERTVAKQLHAAMNRLAAISESERIASLRTQAAKTDLEIAENIHLAARRALHNLIERQAAGAFFRALTPRACPRCRGAIDDKRREHENADQICSVCDRPATSETDPTAQTRGEAEVAETSQSVNAAKVAFEQALDEHGTLTSKRNLIEQEISELHESESLRRRREQEALVFRLEGRLEEREETRRQIGGLGGSADEEIRILEAIKDEADIRVRRSTELFAELNQEVLRLGQRFGVSGLTEVKLDRGAKLPVVKEETKYNFGSLPAGDRLRLKVAVVVALLRIGQRYGAGRHPGLLFVDSPGAEEVSTGSLAEMIDSLAEIAAELGLQVVVSTARLQEMIEIVDAKHIKSPEFPGKTLW